MLSSWIDRVLPQPLDDVPAAFRSQGVERFDQADRINIPFVSFCDPDHTEWMPLPPRQEPHPTFTPLSEADTYNDFATIEKQREEWEVDEQRSLASYATLKDKGVRYQKRIFVIPQSARRPEVQHLVYDVRTSPPTLVDFHAPLDTDINLPFIASLLHFVPPQSKDWPLQLSNPPTYPDMELVSDLFLGARSKAPMQWQSVFCPHGESLRLNLPAAEKQALLLEKRSYASLHDRYAYSPCSYVSNGTTERKDDLG